MPSLAAIVRHMGALSCSDRELLLSLASHPEGPALAELIRRYSGAIQRMAKDICPSQADDITQAVFVVLAQKAALVASHQCAAGWLFETTRRLAIKARTRGYRRTQFERRASSRPHSADPSSELTLREVRMAVHEELSRLPKELQEPLLLCYWEGTTQQDAASRLGCSLSTFKRRLDRGRSRLEARLVRRGFTGASILAAMTVSRTSAKPLAISLSEVIIKEASSKPPVAAILAESAKGSLTGKMAAFTACVVMVGFGLTYALTPQAEQSPKAEAKQPAEKAPVVAKAKTDIYGDPLPDGAVARLGTERFRSDSMIDVAVASPDRKFIYGVGYFSILQWDAETGKIVRRYAAPDWKNHSKMVKAIAISPDGSLMAVSTMDGVKESCPIELFKTDSGEHLGEFKAHTRNIAYPDMLPYSVAFLGNDRLISSGEDGIANVWDLQKRKVILQLERLANDRYFTSFTPSHDGKVIYASGIQFNNYETKTGGFWGTWESQTGKILHQEIVGPVVSLSLSPNGKTLAISASRDYSQKNLPSVIRAYSTSNLKQINAHQIAPTDDMYHPTVYFDEENKGYFTRRIDGKISRWDIDSGKQEGADIATVFTKSFLLDSGTMVAYGTGQEIELWDTNSGKRKKHLPGSNFMSFDVAYSPDGKYIATGGSSVNIWEADSSKHLSRLVTSTPHPRSLSSLGFSLVSSSQFSPDGKQVLVCNSNGVVQLWDWRADKKIIEFDQYHFASATLSPDGRWVAGECYDIKNIRNKGHLRIFDSNTGKELQSFGECLLGQSRRLSFSPNGAALINIDQNNSVNSWDIKSGKLIWQIHRGEEPFKTIGSAIISPGGKWLYSVVNSNEIMVWETETGHYCKTLMRTDGTLKKGRIIHRIALSSDGRYLAAVIGDEAYQVTVECWDRITSTKFAEFTGCRGMVRALAFSPDSRFLTISDIETSALIWKLPPHDNNVPIKGGSSKPFWEDLGSASPSITYDSFCRAVAQGDSTVTELRNHLKPTSAVDQAKVQEWIKQLDSPGVAIREKATAELGKLGLEVDALLQKERDSTTSEEVRSRLSSVLNLIQKQRIRLLRSIEILEMIGSPDAGKLLSEIAGGEYHTDLKAEATQALKRLKQRGRAITPAK